MILKDIFPGFKGGELHHLVRLQLNAKLIFNHGHKAHLADAVPLVNAFHRGIFNFLSGDFKTFYEGIL